MEYMLGRCYNLIKINIKDNFYLTNTIKTNSMIFYVDLLKEVSLKNENINGELSSIDMNSMFEKCNSLINIDLINLKEKN